MSSDLINQPYLREHLYKALTPEFQTENFTLKKSKDRYEKIQSGFRFSYCFLFHRRSSEVAIEQFIYIEHLETERIYKKSSGYSTSGTIGNEIGKIVRNPNDLMRDHQSMELIVKLEEDLPETIKQIKFLLKEVAIPYYNRFSSLKSLDSILNDRPEEITVHANAQYFRFVKGLIIAKLIGREDYHQLALLYDKKMKTMADVFNERYWRVREYLDKIS